MSMIELNLLCCTVIPLVCAIGYYYYKQLLKAGEAFHDDDYMPLGDGQEPQVPPSDKAEEDPY